jgi:GDPmannose 4,6-dehydratase
MHSPGKALVLGANGQDGSYLCEILCARGFDVVAVGRQPQSRWPVAGSHFRYRACDIADMDALAALLRETAPDIVFHFAAIHGPAGFDYEAVWRQAHQVNTLSVHGVLDYIRTVNHGCGLVYASSAKVFGSPPPAQVDEDTPRLSTDIYAITKNAAHALIDHHRARHGAQASVLYLFNHESVRRDPSFFIPRVAEALANALSGKGGKTSLYTLDFACDWGDAREYMDIAADIGERGLGQDYVLATGKTWMGRDMVDALFRQYGLNHADHIATIASGPAPDLYRASNSRLQGVLGRAPERSVLDVIADMLRERAS